MKIIFQPGVTELETILFPAGPNSDAALELRNSIVQEFAARHLKSVVNHPAFKERAREIDELAVDLLLETYAEGSGRSLRLKASARSLFMVEIDAIMADVIKEMKDTVQKRLDAMQEEFDKKMADYRRYLDDRMRGDLQVLLDGAVRRDMDRRLGGK